MESFSKNTTKWSIRPSKLPSLVDYGALHARMGVEALKGNEWWGPGRQT